MWLQELRGQSAETSIEGDQYGSKYYYIRQAYFLITISLFTEYLKTNHATVVLKFSCKLFTKCLR